MASPATAQTQVRARTLFASPLARMIIILVCVDLCMLLLAAVGGFACWSLINSKIPPIPLSLFAAVGFSLVAVASYGLYPGIGLTAVEHIRRGCQAITQVYLLVTASMFLTKDWRTNSRGGFVLAWVFSLVLLLLGRWLCSSYLSNRPWWGVPVIVMGAGETASMVIRNLQVNRTLGYRPVVCFDDDPLKHGDCAGLPVTGSLSDAEFYAAECQIRHAIIAIPGMSREALLRNLQRWSGVFPNVLLIPDLFGVASLWVAPRDLGGVLGLEIRHNLLNPVNRWLKRGMDIILSAFALLLIAPALGISAAWIKLASRGTAFYVQEREGKGGATIRMLKLRTMYPDAENALEMHLAGNPEARAEWDQFCKLKRDPRVLPGVGHFLRRSSFDEVPQLWNVLIGEMSLVGPRPFPAYHNRRFDPEFRALRTQITPGLTGLWQVSARSDGNLALQAALDRYYIRNWSPWLDVYIIMRTATAVITGQGAY